MKYILSEKYDKNLVQQKIMGPNPIKLEEELMLNNNTLTGSLILDLGSGQGLTSVFLTKEYGYKVIAADLWSDPTENKKFFDTMGLTPKQIMPIHADAENLPFAHETFDAIVSTDSYNYFGRDPKYLEEKLLPFIKHGGYIYIAIPGMKKDLHDNLPKELLFSWNEEQLDYIHDINYWSNIINKTNGIDVLEIAEMESNDEVWNDWLECDNEYAIGDRKTMNAGGGKYLNFIKIILKRL